MCRAGAVLALSGLTLLAACGDNQPALPPAPEKQETLTRFEFTIGDVRYAISLPEQAGMRHQRDTSAVTFDSRKNQRLQKILALITAPDRPGETFDRERRLKKNSGSGPVVRYRHIENAGEGSGGMISEIKGQLEIGSNTLFLYCSDQSESVLFAGWCLDYIDSLEVITPPASGSG
jgi:hypothetical protein